MTDNLYFWAGFGVFILVMLALDLGVFHRKSHSVSFREAFTWTGVWVTLACAFGSWLWLKEGSATGVEFFTGYLIELSLSADNVFVFALIFSYFAVPKDYQHKVLFWGVLSALILRFAMIWGGAALIQNFSWIIYVFGAFLVYTGVKMLVKKDTEEHPERNPVVKWFTRVVPTTKVWHGDRFFARIDGRLLATPLMVVLVCVEISDVVFAVDSIPAIFAVTRDPFIVFTSNVFAIMGLRSLYFVLAGAIEKFHYLHLGLGLVLTFVGIKMLLAHSGLFYIPTAAALGIVAGILLLSVVASLLKPKQEDPVSPGA
ncbi:MAG TPA: TerC family protein [Verrucomicrobiales bacterium]|jgi:tellurite resistance protein TerC|nr:TerC family protein [Verrucomicrobiales bacterium]